MSCAHTTEYDERSWTTPEPDGTDACTDCTAIGSTVWAHLRLCLACGLESQHATCPHRHAAAHARNNGHPVMRSFEPGESWRWCYEDLRIV